MGAPDLVADGHVKLVHGQVERLTGMPSSSRRDGSAGRPGRVRDRVLLHNGWAADLISQDVADAVGKVWGLGSDTIKDPGPW